MMRGQSSEYTILLVNVLTSTSRLVYHVNYSEDAGITTAQVRMRIIASNS